MRRRVSSAPGDIVDPCSPSSGPKRIQRGKSKTPLRMVMSDDGDSIAQEGFHSLYKCKRNGWKPSTDRSVAFPPLRSGLVSGFSFQRANCHLILSLHPLPTGSKPAKKSFCNKIIYGRPAPHRQHQIGQNIPRRSRHSTLRWGFWRWSGTLRVGYFWKWFSF